MKSNYNYAGRPELDLAGGVLTGRWRRRLRRLRGRLTGRFNPGAQTDYRIYGNVGEVPDAFFHDPQLVVERFLPERDGEFYVVHNFHFLGDRTTGTRIRSRERIVTQENIVDSEREEAHADVQRLRTQLGFEYGKFDYVVNDNKAVLLDANKTTGSAPTTDPGKLERRRFLAEGLYDYFR